MRRSVDEITRLKNDVAYNGVTNNETVMMAAHEVLDVAFEGLLKIGENTDYLRPKYEGLARGEVPSDRSRRVFDEEGIKPLVESLRFRVDE
ncbi:MAG: hypothetical protein KGH62_01530, partial [Candidatus Micrarchaeota archaeon]|nr:hypothetical protein [Candidatus Micrarchaeota archaeon]